MKRYQVFISSTYTDLKEERSAVQRSVLKLRHIPVGMEQFVASNEEQFSYIKKLLDDTDYYIVIVGNRYGSIADDGLSYTEKEFDYAVSLGIPVIACVHSNPNAFPVDRSDTDKKSIEKLKKFREKIMKNRLVSYIDWTTPEALTSEVVVALVNMINDYPRPGWERAGSYDKSDLLSQINELRIENDQLKSRLKETGSSEYESELINKFSWDDTLLVHGYIKDVNFSSFSVGIEFSWSYLLNACGNILFAINRVDAFCYELSKVLFWNKYPFIEIDHDDFQMIISKLGWLGIIEISGEVINLTKDGKKLLRSEKIKIPIDSFQVYYQQVESLYNLLNLKKMLLEFKEKILPFGYDKILPSVGQKKYLNSIMAFLKDEKKKDYPNDIINALNAFDIQVSNLIEVCSPEKTEDNSFNNESIRSNLSVLLDLYNNVNQIIEKHIKSNKYVR